MNLKRVEEYYSSDEYKRKLNARFEALQKMDGSEYERARMILDVYSVDPIAFIETFLFVKLPNYNNAIKPFFLFEYQKKIIQKLWEAEQDNQEHTILIDKPREMGITYTVLAYFYWRWLFTPEHSSFLLSRSEDEVDKGETSPDNSLFGKLRWMNDLSPKWILPDAFAPKGKKGTSTDRERYLFNPQLKSQMIGSTTNANAGRSRRYSITFIDECFFIDNFQQIIRSLESVSRVKVLVSSAQPGRQYEKFKDMCAGRGDYVSLTWRDHPWKDQEWYDNLERKAEEMDDPEILREAVVQYSIDPKSRYYPQITDAKVAKIEYDRNRPLYLSMDTGRSDFTVLVWWQYVGSRFHIIECVQNKNREGDWYAPFINPTLEYNPEHYKLRYYKQVLDKVRTWKKPQFLFSGLDVKAKKFPLNKSTEEYMYPLIGMKITVNNYAEDHESRRTATSKILPLTTFNEDSQGVMDLYDAIANSQYASAVKGTSKISAMKPVHGSDGTSDFRSAFEYGCTNIVRIVRMQRTEQRSPPVQDTISELAKYLRV